MTQPDAQPSPVEDVFESLRDDSSPKLGRPPAAGEARDQQVATTLTKEEAAKIARAAKFLGISKAELIRQTVLNSSLVSYALDRLETIHSI